MTIVGITAILIGGSAALIQHLGSRREERRKEDTELFKRACENITPGKGKTLDENNLADLANADLTRADLRRADFRSVRVPYLNLDHADLRGALLPREATDWGFTMNWRSARFDRTVKRDLIDKYGPAVSGPLSCCCCGSNWLKESNRDISTLAECPGNAMPRLAGPMENRKQQNRALFK